MEEILNEDTISAFMDYLIKLKYTETEIRTPPKTKVLLEDIEAGMNLFEIWIREVLLQNDSIIDLELMLNDNIDGCVRINELKRNYEDWVKERKAVQSISQIIL